MNPKLRLAGIVCLGAVLVAGCGGQDAPESEDPAVGADGQGQASTVAPQDSLTDTELGRIERRHVQLALSWTQAPTRRSPPEAGAPVPLQGWQIRGRDRFDRFVLTFGEGDLMPGYRVEFVEAPITGCASDAELDVQGRAFLRVRVSGASPGEGFQRDLAITPRRNVRALHLACEAENELDFVLPLNSKRDYRILEARSPNRLVVDILNGTGGP